MDATLTVQQLITPFQTHPTARLVSARSFSIGTQLKIPVSLTARGTHIPALTMTRTMTMIMMGVMKRVMKRVTTRRTMTMGTTKMIIQLPTGAIAYLATSGTKKKVLTILRFWDANSTAPVIVTLTARKSSIPATLMLAYVSLGISGTQLIAAAISTVV